MKKKVFLNRPKLWENYSKIILGFLKPPQPRQIKSGGLMSQIRRILVTFQNIANWAYFFPILRLMSGWFRILKGYIKQIKNLWHFVLGIMTHPPTSLDGKKVWVIRNIFKSNLISCDSRYLEDTTLYQINWVKQINRTHYHVYSVKRIYWIHSTRFIGWNIYTIFYLVILCDRYNYNIRNIDISYILAFSDCSTHNLLTWRHMLLWHHMVTISTDTCRWLEYNCLCLSICLI